MEILGTMETRENEACFFFKVNFGLVDRLNKVMKRELFLSQFGTIDSANFPAFQYFNLTLTDFASH